MISPPSSAIAGAAVAAVQLAAVLDHLSRTSPVPAETARAGVTAARQVAQITAPRIVGLGDAAAIVASLIASVQTVARAGSPGDMSAGLYAAATATHSCAPTSFSPRLTQAYGLARGLCVGMETACLGEAFLAEARTEFADRQSAVAARARITGAMDKATDRISAALGQATIETLGFAARQVCAFLVAEAATLQPISRVKTFRSLPATALAWMLYRDPSRAADLVARNRVATPFFMPTVIEALTPDAG